MFLWSTIAHMIAVSSPGPDTAIVIRQVNIYGRSSGYRASLGISIGVLIHCLLAVNGISILIIEHDVKLITSLCDIVYVMDRGKIISHGTPGVIKNDQAVINAYLGKNAKD